MRETRVSRTVRSKMILLLVACSILTLGAVSAAGLPSTAAVGDMYEPDNSYTAATTLLPGYGPVPHTIDPEDDEDWFSFAVADGWTYTLWTSAVSGQPTVDTILELYDSDGTSLLEADDESGDGHYSLIEWEADGAKTVYARVRGWDYGGSYGIELIYAPPTTGSITGTVTDGVDPIPDVIVDAYEPDGLGGWSHVSN